MRAIWLSVVLLTAAVQTACGGEEAARPSPTLRPSATSVPTRTAIEPTPGPQATQAPREVTGLFLEPRPNEPDAFVGLPTRPASPFEPWDRASVVVYDIEQGTATNFGPGYVVSISPDETRLAYNVQPPVGANEVHIVDLATGETVEEFDWTGGLASFIDDDHLYLPGPGQVQVVDLRNGERVPLEEIDDPDLRAALQSRATGQIGFLVDDGRYRLHREAWEDGANPCQKDPGPGESYELCEAARFERWTLEEVASGAVVLAFRAYSAAPGGPGELIVSTSPQCDTPDGTVRWCPEVLEDLRADDPEGEFPYEEAHGTTNIFIVDIETGEAAFIATASFAANTRITPANWPLIGNQENIVWTESYCSLESPGNTRIHDRATGETTEIDASLWVEFTATGDLGVGAFGPQAILNISTLDWKAVLPDGVVDVGESSSGRYLFVGGVLGHGGLCG